jgi:hypothetical protein
LVVVFNQLRGMSLIRARESADGFAEPRRVQVVKLLVARRSMPPTSVSFYLKHLKVLTNLGLTHLSALQNSAQGL